MDRETVVRYTKRTPFVAFVLHLSDGQVLRVQHPEVLAMGDQCLGLSMEDKSKHVVAFEQIVSIQYG